MTGPTIYDVARESGVSIKTVSRVINGAPNVRDTTSQRVNEAVKRLHYHPNPAARYLSGGKLPTIGVVVDEISDPFFSGVIAVVERRAMQIGMDVLVASSGMDQLRMRTQIQRLVRRGVSALIIAPVGAEARAALPDKVPTVVIDRRSGISDKDVVRAGDEKGALEAVRHLLRHGHRHVAFVGMTSAFTTVQDRYTGYEKALREAHLEPEPHLVETRGWTSEEAYPHVLCMLASPHAPTAIFAATPMMGIAVLRAQRHLHRQDVALVVFGDFPTADLMTPNTTVVDQRPTQLAETAFSHLVRRMEAVDAVPQETIIATVLVPRGSGELDAKDVE